jgi:hypothetical protein
MATKESPLGAACANFIEPVHPYKKILQIDGTPAASLFVHLQAIG